MIGFFGDNLDDFLDLSFFISLCNQYLVFVIPEAETAFSEFHFQNFALGYCTSVARRKEKRSEGLEARMSMRIIL